MKAFIDKVFKAKREKEESIQDLATEAAIKSIKSEKPKHDITQCGCHECELKRDQGAK